MKEINGINVARMNNGAHFTFMSNILARAEADATVKVKVAELVEAFKTAMKAEDDALKLSQKNLLSDDIAQADRERDALYLGYRNAVSSFLTLPTPEMAKAAKELAQHIKDYSIDPREQLDKETGLLVNFINDLETKFKTQVEKLGLTFMVSSLKDANERVRSYTLERTEDRMTQTVGATKMARAAVDKAYYDLVKMVNALALVNGDADYADFIDYVNTEIKHYKREVLNQKPGSSSDSSDGSGSDGGDDTGGSDGGSGDTGGDGGSGSDGGDTGGGTGGGDEFYE